MDHYPHDMAVPLFDTRGRPYKGDTGIFTKSL